MPSTPDKPDKPAGKKIRVLIVDDSPTVRAVLRGMVTRDPRFELVGVAGNGIDALAQIDTHKPDVCTLDIEMPRLDGLGVLDRCIGRYPVAFIMISTLTQTGARVTLEALRRGAFDYIPKPENVLGVQRDEFGAILFEKIVAASKAKNRRPKLEPDAKKSVSSQNSRGWIVGIGISCGGPQTLVEMMPAFPADFAPILVTQHMPREFTPMFARHLDQVCAMRAKQAENGDIPQPGQILVAPGDRHLCLKRVGTQVQVVLNDGPKVSGHRPSADAMFASMAATCAPRCIGVIMTGMGHDGTNGIVKLHHAGCPTVGQDEATSLVYGMPAAAAATGCVDRVVALSQIPRTVAALIARTEARAAGAVIATAGAADRSSSG